MNSPNFSVSRVTDAPRATSTRPESRRQDRKRPSFRIPNPVDQRTRPKLAIKIGMPPNTAAVISARTSSCRSIDISLDRPTLLASTKQLGNISARQNIAAGRLAADCGSVGPSQQVGPRRLAAVENRVGAENLCRQARSRPQCRKSSSTPPRPPSVGSTLPSSKSRREHHDVHQRRHRHPAGEFQARHQAQHAGHQAQQHQRNDVRLRLFEAPCDSS